MRGTFELLKPILTGRDFSLQNKMLLYKGSTLPLATYAASVWAFASKTNINKIEATHRKFLRRMRKTHYFVNNQTIRRDLKAKTLRDAIKKHARRFYANLYSVRNDILYSLPDYNPSELGKVREPLSYLKTLNHFSLQRELFSGLSAGLPPF